MKGRIPPRIRCPRAGIFLMQENENHLLYNKDDFVFRSYDGKLKTYIRF